MARKVAPQPEKLLGFVQFIEASFKAGEVVVGSARLLAAAAAGAGIAAQPKPQSELEKLDQQLKVKIATHEDGKRVLKLSDGIECCESALNTGAIGIGFLIRLGTILSSQFIDIKAGAPIEPIVNCMRLKVLTQDNPRISVTKTVNSRKP